MSPSYYFSAPSRTEISGNHTDHQHGCVLAAAYDEYSYSYPCAFAARHDS